MTRLVTFGDTALRLTPPDSERLESARDVRMRADGTESNAAVAATRLGTPTVWISKLPDTELGRRVRSELHAHGLETDVIWTESGRQGLAFAERASQPREDTLIQDRGESAAATATPGELPMTLVQQADATLIGGTTPALGPTARETTEAIFRAASGTTVFDLDFQPGLWSVAEARESLGGFLDAVDVLIANEDDAKTIFDRSGKPRDIVHSVAAEHEFETVVVTRSEHGAIAYADGVIHEQDAIDTEAVDDSGQHAAFVGGFLSSVLDEDPIEDALEVASAMAALTRTIPGPMTTVDREAVERLVASPEDNERGI